VAQQYFSLSKLLDNPAEIVGCDNIQFTEAPNVLGRGMGLNPLAKSELSRHARHVPLNAQFVVREQIRLVG
jgi:hypothetical protein